MDTLATLLTGLLVLAAPAAGFYYIGERAGADDAPAAPAPADPAEERGLLRYRVHHDGAPVAALLRVLRADGSLVEERAVDLTASREVVLDLHVPVGAYVAELATGDDLVLVPRFRVEGSMGADLAACPARSVEMLVQTYDYPAGQGIVVPGAECLPGAQRHVGVQRIALGAAAPFPACPLSCTVAYGFAGEGGLRFDVDERATIRVAAARHDTLPTAPDAEVWLGKRGACGSGCYEVVAAQRLGRETSFELMHAEPGEYSVSIFLGGPAAAAVEQYAWLMAAVAPA